MASAAVHSKAMVLFLLIHCLLLLPLFQDFCVWSLFCYAALSTLLLVPVSLPRGSVGLCCLIVVLTYLSSSIAQFESGSWLLYFKSLHDAL